MRHELQMLMANGEWQNPEGKTFDTQAEAEAGIAEFAHKYGGLYFVSGYCFSDFNAEDWRVAEC